MAHKRYFVAAHSGTNLLQNPDTTALIITYIPLGEAVEVLSEEKTTFQLHGRSGKWAKVNYEGKTGWVFSGFLSQDSLLIHTQSLDDGVKITGTFVPHTHGIELKENVRTKIEKHKEIVKEKESQASKDISVIDLWKESDTPPLYTYNYAQLEDLYVKGSEMQPLKTENDEVILGKYMGPLGADRIINLKLEKKNQTLQGTLSYHGEVVLPDGMIDYVQGELQLNQLKLHGSILSWNKQKPIEENYGQFVQWTNDGKTEIGFLMYYITGKNIKFKILRKVN
ncbi:MAG: SH3 domain-containing protein [Bacteroidia bacterium]|nr:SH3 domain-containing protein [Bacteroidia bacterium]